MIRCTKSNSKNMSLCLCIMPRQGMLSEALWLLNLHTRWCSASISSDFTTVKVLSIELCGKLSVPRTNLDVVEKRKVCSLPRINPPALQKIINHCTDTTQISILHHIPHTFWVYPTHILWDNKFDFSPLFHTSVSAAHYIIYSLCCPCKAQNHTII
jgi:hypothetical protein